MKRALLILSAALALAIPFAAEAQSARDLDSNGDGGISWSEYSRRMPAPIPGDRLDSEIFREGDLDKDGKLSYAEYSELRTELERAARARYHAPPPGGVAPTFTPNPLIGEQHRDVIGAPFTDHGAR